jgi:hypothetical protein
MARPKNSNQTEIKEELLTLKLGTIQVPYIDDGQGKWKTVTQANWNLKDQAAIFEYWRKVLFSELDEEKKAKAIQGKKDKLFMPVEELEEA